MDPKKVLGRVFGDMGDIIIEWSSVAWKNKVKIGLNTQEFYLKEGLIFQDIRS